MAFRTIEFRQVFKCISLAGMLSMSACAGNKEPVADDPDAGLSFLTANGELIEATVSSKSIWKINLEAGQVYKFHVQSLDGDADIFLLDLHPDYAAPSNVRDFSTYSSVLDTPFDFFTYEPYQSVTYYVYVSHIQAASAPQAFLNTS